MNIYLVTSPINFASEQDLIENMYAFKPFSLHIRKPNFSEREMEKYLLSLAPEILENAVLHGFKDLSNDFGIQNREQYFWRESITELPEIIPENSKYFLFSVFDSFSNPDKKGFLKSNSDLLKRFLEKNKENLIGAGGIDSDNFEILKEIGFKNIALSGGIWNYADSVSVFKKWVHLGNFV